MRASGKLGEVAQQRGTCFSWAVHPTYEGNLVCAKTICRRPAAAFGRAMQPAGRFDRLTFMHWAGDRPVPDTKFPRHPEPIALGAYGQRPHRIVAPVQGSPASSLVTIVNIERCGANRP